MTQTSLLHRKARQPVRVNREEGGYVIGGWRGGARGRRQRGGRREGEREEARRQGGRWRCVSKGSKLSKDLGKREKRLTIEKYTKSKSGCGWGRVWPRSAEGEGE